jgi:hypothetical protein
VLPELPPGFEGDRRSLDAGATWARGWDAFFVVDAPSADAESDDAHRASVFPGLSHELELVARRGRFAAYRWAMRRTVETK